MPASLHDEDEYEIRLKPDTRARMAQAAQAAGERIPSGHGGHPSASALVRKYNGVARSLLIAGNQPHNTSLARVGVLHAGRRNAVRTGDRIDVWDALRELCVVVNLRTGEVVDFADSRHEIAAAA